MTSTAETLRRDLHASTAQVSSLLTRYAKLAAQASTSYSSSGILKDDVGRRKDELEGELDGALESVRSFSSRKAGMTGIEWIWSIVLRTDRTAADFPVYRAPTAVDFRRARARATS